MNYHHCPLARHLGCSKGTVSVMSVLQALWIKASVFQLWWYHGSVMVPFSRRFYPKWLRANLLQGQPPWSKLVFGALLKGTWVNLWLILWWVWTSTFCRGMSFRVGRDAENGWVVTSLRRGQRLWIWITLYWCRKTVFINVIVALLNNYSWVK